MSSLTLDVQGHLPMTDSGSRGPYLSMAITFTALARTDCLQKDRIRDSRILFVCHPFSRTHSA